MTCGVEMGDLGVILLFRAKGIKKQYAENYGDCFLGHAMGFCVNVEKLMNILKTTLFIVLVQNILKLIALSFFSIKFAT